MVYTIDKKKKFTFIKLIVSLTLVCLVWYGFINEPQTVYAQDYSSDATDGETLPFDSVTVDKEEYSDSTVDKENLKETKDEDKTGGKKAGETVITKDAKEKTENKEAVNKISANENKTNGKEVNSQESKDNKKVENNNISQKTENSSIEESKDDKKTDLNTEKKETDVKKTNAKETNVREADVKEADVKEADVKKTDVKEIDLKKNDVEKTDILQADIKAVDEKKTTDNESIKTTNDENTLSTFYIYDDDIYIVVDNDKKGLNAVKYDTNIVKEIIVNGTGKDDTFYFDLTGKYDNLTVIKLDGTSGHDIITTTLDSLNLDANSCNIEFIAEEVLFDMKDKSNWKINSIKVDANPDKSDAIDFVLPRNDTKIDVKLSNLKVTANEDIVIEANVELKTNLMEVISFAGKTEEFKNWIDKSLTEGIDCVAKKILEKIDFSKVAELLKDVNVDLSATKDEILKQVKDECKNEVDKFFTEHGLWDIVGSFTENIDGVKEQLNKEIEKSIDDELKKIQDYIDLDTVVETLKDVDSNASEEIFEQQLKALLRGVLEGFYKKETDKFVKENITPLVKEADEYVQIFNESEFSLKIKNIDINIDISKCILEGKNIFIKSSVDSKVYTIAMVLPAVVNIFDLQNNIKINDSQLKAIVGDIKIDAISKIDSTAGTVKKLNATSLNMAVAISTMDSNSKVSLLGDSKIEARGTIDISNLNDISLKSIANSDKEAQNGGAISFVIVDQETNVDILDNVSIISENGNVNISSDEYLKNEAKAQLSDKEFEEKWELLDVENSKIKKSVKDIFASLKSLFTKKDDKDKEKPVVDKEKVDNAEEKINKAVDTLANDKQDDKETKAKLQLVGTAAIAIIDNKNLILVRTNGAIIAGNEEIGKVSIKANGYSNNIVLSDASVQKPRVKNKTEGEKAEGEKAEENKTKEEKTKEVTNGLGVALAVDIVNYTNLVNIDSVMNIKAREICIEASTGKKDGETQISGKSDVTAKSGYNVGDFGLGGAIAVNEYNNVTDAIISDNVVLELNGGSLSVNAKEEITSDVKTTTQTVSINVEEEKKSKDNNKDDKEKSTGIGAVLVVTNINSDIEAVINGKVTGNIEKLDVIANKQGKNTISSDGGSKGTNCIAPNVVINNFTSCVNAYVSEKVDLNVLQKADIEATSKNENKINASATSESKEKGIDAAIVFSSDKFETYAQLDGIIKSSNSKDSTLVVKINENNTSDITSKAAANIATKKTENKDKEDKEKTEDKDKESKDKEDKEQTENKDKESKDKENKEKTEDKDKEKGFIGKKVDELNKYLNTEFGKLNGFIKKNRNVTDNKNNKKDDKTTPPQAATTEGSIEVAGVVAVQLISDTSYAKINNNVNNINKLDVETNSNLKALLNADASAVTKGAKNEKGVGVAVAIQKINKESLACIVASENVNAGSINVVETSDNNILSKSISGAGASDVGVAGSVSISIVDIGEYAYIDSININANEDVNIKTTQKNSYNVLAKAKEDVGNSSAKGDEDDNSVGVGASFALAIMNNDELAYIDNRTKNINIKNGSLNINSLKTKTKNNDFDIVVEAEAGEKPAEDKDNENIAIDAAVAIAIINASVQATANKGALIEIGKDINCNAQSESSVRTKAYGCAIADDVAVGATVALNLVYEEVLALFESDVKSATNINVTSNASTTDISQAWATANGVKVINYTKKYSFVVDKILNGDYLFDVLDKVTSKEGKESGQTANSDEEAKAKKASDKKDDSTDDTNIPDKVNEILVGKDGKYSNELSTSENICANYVKTVNVNTSTSDVVDNNNIASIDSEENVSSNVNKDVQTTNAGTTSDGNSIAVAAAVACNIISHDTKAIITGRVEKANSVNVQATNKNNFQSMGTGETVDDKSAIAAGVSVMINNSDAVSYVANDIIIEDDNDQDTENDLKIKSETTNNADLKKLDYEIASLAIAGAATGEDGKMTIAGAVAVLVTNATTIAQIKNVDGKAPIIKVINGNVKVEAVDKNKLSAKAWAASISSKALHLLADFKESEANNDEKSVGVGAAFAVLTSNNKTGATIEKNTIIEANSVDVLAKKVIVSSSDYEWEFNLNGKLNFKRKLKNVPFAKDDVPVEFSIPINITSNDNSNKEIKIEEIEDFLIDALIKNPSNYLAANNYYVEAAGGSVNTNSKSGVNCTGSFAIMYYNDEIISNIADGVKITFNKDKEGKLTIKADDETNSILISGSGSIGSSTCVGASVPVIINNGLVKASIGKNNASTVEIIGQKGIDVISNLKGNVILVGISAGVTNGKNNSGESSSVAVTGIVGVVRSFNDVEAYIENAKLEGTGNITVDVNNNLMVIEVLGSAGVAGKVGVGASVGVNVIDNKSIAFIGDNVTIGSDAEYAGDVKVLANSSEWILSVVANGAASKESVSVAASPAILIVNTTTNANLYADKVYANSVEVIADGNTKLIVIAGGISLALKGTAVGGAVQVNILNKDVKAWIGEDSTLLNVKGDVIVKATSNDELVNVTAGLDAAKQVSVSGSIDVIVINNDVLANVYADGAIDGDLDVSSKENADILAIAGSLDLSTSSVGVGFANADIIFRGSTKANVDSKNELSVAKDIYVIADTYENILATVVPVSVAKMPAISGGVGVIVLNESTQALLGGTISAKSIKINADDKTKIKGFVIGVSASGNVSVGGCIGQITFIKDVKAMVKKGSDITTTNGNLIIETNNDENVLFFVAGASGSGKCAVDGSILNTVVSDDNLACVESTTANNKNTLNIAKELIIVSNNLQDIRSITGAIGGSGSVAAGGAINTVIFEGSLKSYLGSNTNAIVEGSDTGYTYFDGEITSKNGDVSDYNDYNGGLNKNSTNYYGILIGAVNNQIIDNWAICGMGSGSVAAGGSVIVTTLNESTTAEIMSDCNVISKKGIAVIALDETQITSQAGQIMGSGTVAVGVGTDTLYLNKKVNAYIEEGSTVKALGGNILVIADSYEFLRSMTVGISASGSVSVNGSASIVVIENELVARIGATKDSESARKTIIESTGSTVVKSEDYKELLTVSGSASGSGSVSVGAGCSVITSGQKADAYLGDNVFADVLGITGITFYTGCLDSAGRKEKKYMYGLLIGAFNTNDMYQIVFSASGAAVGVAASVATLVDNDTTSAMINANSRINQGNREYSSKAVVKVVAVDKSDLDSVDGGAAGGFVGVGAAVIVTTYNKTVKAYIAPNSDVFANAGVDVYAYSYSKSDIIGAGLGGGAVGVAGTSSTYIVKDNVEAYIGGNVVSNGDVNVTAKTTSDLEPISGTVAGGAVGVGATVVVFTFSGSTKAYIAKNAVVKAGKDVNVIAESKEDLLLVAGAGAGGAVGVAGAFGVAVINVTTKAYTENGVDIKASGNLFVKASDNSELLTTVGNIAGGAIAVGSATDVFVYKNTVAALIGENNNISASAITVQADNNRNVKAYALGAAGGAIGVNGSILVMLIGASANEELYSYSEGNKSVKSNASEYIGTDGYERIDSTANDAYNSSIVNIDKEHKNAGITKANDYILAAKKNLVSMTDIFGSYVEDKTIALIGINSNVVSTKGDISVIANETNNLEYVAGTVGAGAFGVGISVAVAVLKGTVESVISGNVNSAQNVNIKSNSKVNADKFYTVAGTTGAGTSGGAVSVISANGNIKAYQGAGDIKANKNVNINADLQMPVTPYTLEGSVGGIATGACVAVTNVDGKVQALTVDNASISKAEKVTIKANGVVTSSPKTKALTGGLLAAGNAAVSIMNVKVYVEAVASGDIINTKDAEIASVLVVNSNVVASGNSIAGAASGGATVLYVTITPNVYADIKNSIIDITGSLEIYALYNYIKANEDFKTSGKVEAIASASNKALLASLSGAVMYLSSGGNAYSYITNSTVNVGGDIAVVSLGNFVINANGGESAYSIGLGAGAVVVTINSSSDTRAYINASTVDAMGGILIDAKNLGNFDGNAKGEAGGLLAAGNAQVINVTQNSTSLAYVGDNSTIKAKTGGIVIHADNDTVSSIYAKGNTISGFVSGGASVANLNVTKVTKAYVGNNSDIFAKELIDIQAAESAKNKGNASASAAALGGSAAGTIINVTLNNTTLATVGSSTKLSSEGDINIIADSDNNNSVEAAGTVAGIVAAGAVNSRANMYDNTNVSIGENASITAIGNVYILSNVNENNASNSLGGAGGVASGNDTETNAYSDIDSTINTGNNVSIISKKADVSIYAYAKICGRYKATMSHSINGVSKVDLYAGATTYLDTTITLGNATKISGINVSILSQVQKIDLDAYVNMTSINVIHAKIRPESVLNTVANSNIKGSSADIRAVDKLMICAIVDTDVKITTYSYGDTAGATGSVISETTNNASINANISIKNTDSVLKGNNVIIKASAPRKSQVSYKNEAKYDAHTATEFVKKAVEVFVEVVETVTEKVCSWLGWLGKVIKWVVKQVTRLIKKIVEVIVEVVLQSECDAKEYGDYNYANNIELYGSIYYGSSSKASIEIEEVSAGDLLVTGSSSVDYIVDKANKTVTINKFVANKTSGMLISSSGGSISGDVTIYSDQIVQDVNITNKTSYALRVNNINLTENGEDGGESYRIEALYNNLKVKDASTISTLPAIHINTTNGADVILDGNLSNYTATLDIIFGEKSGNIFMSDGTQLDINKLYVKNANNIGTITKPLVVNLYGIQDNNGKKQKPVIDIDANNDVYIDIIQKQLITDISEDIYNKPLEGFEKAIFNTEGKLNVTFRGAYILVIENTLKEVLMDFEYTYTDYEYAFEDIELPICSVIEKDEDGNETTIYQYLADCIDKDGNLHKEGEEFTYDKDKYDAVAVVGKTDRYYLINITIDELENEIKTKTYIDATVTEYTDEEGNVHYICDEYLDEESENKYIEKVTDEYVYQLLIVKEVEKTEHLNETAYVNDILMMQYPVSGIYNITSATGKDIVINAYSSLKDKNNDKLVLGDITATNSININAYSDMPLIIAGRVSIKNTDNSSLKKYITVNATGKLIFEKGTIGGNTTNNVVDIKAQDIQTSKRDGYDIIGAFVNVTSAEKLGNKDNAIKVFTGKEGIKAQSLTDSVYILTNDTIAYVNDIRAINEVSIVGLSIYNATSTENFNASIKANEIFLLAIDYIGTNNDMLRVETVKGIEATAKKGIYLLSNKDIRLLKLECEEDIVIKAIEANIYNHSYSGDTHFEQYDNIVGKNVTLIAENGSIGDSSFRNGLIGIRLIGGVLDAYAAKDIDINMFGKAKITKVQSTDGDVRLLGNDDITADKVIANKALVITPGGILDLEYATASELVSLHPMKSLILGVVKAKEVIIESRKDEDVIAKDVAKSNIETERLEILARNVGTKLKPIIINKTNECNYTIITASESAYLKDISQKSIMLELETKDDLYIDAEGILYIYKLNSNNAYISANKDIWCGHLVANNDMLLDTDANLYMFDTHDNLYISDADKDEYAFDIYNEEYEHKICVTADKLVLRVEGNIGDEDNNFITDMEGTNSTLDAVAEGYVYLKDLEGFINVVNMLSNTSYIELTTNGNTDIQQIKAKYINLYTTSGVANIYNAESEETILIKATNCDVNVYYANANSCIDMNVSGNIGISRVITNTYVYIISKNNVYNIGTLEEINIEAKDLFIFTYENVCTKTLPLITNIDKIYTSVGKDAYIINKRDLYIYNLRAENNANIEVEGTTYVKKAYVVGSMYIKATEDVTVDNIETIGNNTIISDSNVKIDYVNIGGNNTTISKGDIFIENADIIGDNTISTNDIVINNVNIGKDNNIKANDVSIKTASIGRDNNITANNVIINNANIGKDNNISARKSVNIETIKIKANNDINVTEGPVDILEAYIDGNSIIKADRKITTPYIEIGLTNTMISENDVILDNANIGADNNITANDVSIISGDVGQNNNIRANNVIIKKIITGRSNNISAKDVVINNANIGENNTISAEKSVNIEIIKIKANNVIDVTKGPVDILEAYIDGYSVIKADGKITTPYIEIGGNNIMVSAKDVVLDNASIGKDNDITASNVIINDANIGKDNIISAEKSVDIEVINVKVNSNINVIKGPVDIREAYIDGNSIIKADRKITTPYLEIGGSSTMISESDVIINDANIGKDNNITAINIIIENANIGRDNTMSAKESVDIEIIKIKANSDINVNGPIDIWKAYIDGDSIIKADKQVTVTNLDIGGDNIIETNSYVNIINSEIGKDNTIKTVEYVYIKNIDIKGNSNITSEQYIDMGDIQVDKDNNISTKEYLKIAHVKVMGSSYMSSDKDMNVLNINTGVDNEVISGGNIVIGPINARRNNKVIGNSDINIENVNVGYDNTIESKGNLVVDYVNVDHNNRMIAKYYIKTIMYNVRGNNYVKQRA